MPAVGPYTSMDFKCVTYKKAHLTAKSIHRQKVNNQNEILHTKGIQKKAGIIIVTTDRIVFNLKIVRYNDQKKITLEKYYYTQIYKKIIRRMESERYLTRTIIKNLKNPF